jgi:Bacterial regulatory helix-turn-helix protein, lysR family
LGILRYVVAAVQKRSFRQAAIKQGLRESTIGRVIRKLEDEIGVALFIRYPDGVKLTNAGSKFLSRARMAVESGRYQLQPAANAKSIANDATAKAQPDYLNTEIRQRAEKEPVKFSPPPTA